MGLVGLGCRVLGVGCWLGVGVGRLGVGVGEAGGRIMCRPHGQAYTEYFESEAAMRQP